MPFDAMPEPLDSARGRLLSEREHLETALAVLRDAQARIGTPKKWMCGANVSFSRTGERRICARQAITEALGAHGNDIQPVDVFLVYGAVASEASPAIHAYCDPHTVSVDWALNLVHFQHVIERANDMKGGYPRVMGMFCRAIARLETALA
jgi:hypothetical protein